jgi:hypothetical protein
MKGYNTNILKSKYNDIYPSNKKLRKVNQYNRVEQGKILISR